MNSTSTKSLRCPPSDFSPTLSVVGCCISFKNRILLLQRSPSCSQGNTWGIPAGKVEPKETIHEAILRETKEETGISLSHHEVDYCGQTWMRLPHADYIFHLYKADLNKEPKIHLSEKEHEAFRFVTVEEARSLPLIEGAQTVLDQYEESGEKGNYNAHINVNLILKKGRQVLLSKRMNTGYFDGHWGVISGHVERGESATQAAIREAYEEAGIVVHPESLKMGHAMYRIHDRLNLDLFFVTESWERSVQNLEPHKCSELQFFKLDAFPSPTIPYIAKAFRKISEESAYSEEGWGSI